MDATVILTGVGTIITVVGSNIALISWLRADMKSFETEVRGWREETHKEMKDFHGKLERQDAEFKSHLLHIHKEADARPTANRKSKEKLG